MSDARQARLRLRVLIRTDGSAAIGAGHLSRCLSLGTALREAGSDVVFACAEPSAVSEEMCRTRGFRPIALGSGPARRTHSEGTTPAAIQSEDAQECKALAAGGMFDWAIVDHYGLDAAWERQMRPACRQILAIDDLANRPHDCDVLIDQNLREDGGLAYDPRLPRGCERLLGPRFALLDGSFAAARSALDDQPRDRILVSFGGGDPHAMTQPVVRALRRTCAEWQSIDVVVGPMQADGPSASALEGIPGVTVHHATREMAKLMSNARLFVGAGGTTSWERCCVGLPGVVVSVADNQVGPCTALEEAGSHVYLGSVPGVEPDAIAGAAAAVLASPIWAERLARRSFELVDGLGTERVVRRMLRGRMRVRIAEAGDESKLLRWRNDAAVRRYSGSRSEIGAEDHARWYASKMNDPDCHLLIGEDAQGEAGVVRYDVSGSAATVSVYVQPERLGSGAGSALLAAGERWLAEHRPSVDAICAEVQADNRTSTRLFAGAGYRARAHSYIKSLTGRGSE